MKLNLPHWVLVLVTLLGALAPQVGSAFPALATAMHLVAQLAVLVVGALGLVTGSAITAKQFPAMFAAKRLAEKLGPPVAGILLLGLVVGTQSGCQVPAQDVTDVVIGLNAAVCVLDTYTADTSAGQTVAQAVADSVIKCGVTAAQASGVLAAHANAEMADKKASPQ